MPTHVYANGQEIACKAADGKASTAFPDPCWSPPAPPIGPIVIPYGNVAHPRNLVNGSYSVFIGGKPVFLEDHSYFSTSTGNEAATQAFGKGVATGVIKGKAYFRSWSMNVMIEGRGVARHGDIVTHNHGSQPGNTPSAPYLARSWRGGDKNDKCKEDRERVNKECSPDGELTDEHCADLNTKARGLSNAEAYAELNQVRSRIQHELKAQKNAEQFEELRNSLDDFNERAAQFNTPKDVNSDDSRKQAQALTADGHGILATLNDCLVAHKCRLVPYAAQGKTKTKPSTNGGCCAGQTGHHLIYDDMVKKGGCPPYHPDTNPQGYRKETAPTVCVEGANQYHGTHGLVHGKMDEIVGKTVKNGYLDSFRGKRLNLNTDGTMNQELAVEAAAQSHAAAFPRAGCSPDCIRAQLNDYYGKTCPNASFAAVDKRGEWHDNLEITD